MTLRLPTPWLIASLSEAGLRERLSEARTLLMYGHTPQLRTAAMRVIDAILDELKARGVAA